MMKDFKKMLRAIGHHGEILFRGFAKMLYGVLMAALLAMGAYGLIVVSTEGGYAAVCDFLIAVCTMFLALVGIYLMGGRCKKGAAK